mmetsp:Transcript_11032/g.9396  ORF Transcript_11032/g.9396 Transcript_11032/m.9396 type:complete len:106 (+) Transcript_11032:1557-1874(+)
MERNNSILGKRRVNDNVIASRKTFVTKWKTDLNKIYSSPNSMPDVPEFDEIEDIDIEALRSEAIHMEITEKDIWEAFKGKKASTATGISAINYALLKKAAIADPT